jgi:hypothetical protein
MIKRLPEMEGGFFMLGRIINFVNPVGSKSNPPYQLTQRAPDVWDSAAFSSIFLASVLYCSQAESTPAHTQVTQTVGQALTNPIEVFYTRKRLKG